MNEDKKPQLDASWLEVLQEEFEKPYMTQLRAFLKDEMRRGPVYPPGKHMFQAFNSTPFEKVRVIILGQDPYHGPGQAHGLSFSVQRGVQPPPSLVNMFKEIHESLAIPPAQHGDLSSWAAQGVLLLNTTLSVRQGQPKSHAGRGWETFTDMVIRKLNEKRDHLIFVLWGSHAKQKAQLIDGRRHLILTAPHPSPLSAYRGFFGCGHFVRINQHLQQLGQQPIQWKLPDE